MGLPVEREVPAWIDRDDNVVEECDVFGCIVTHDMIPPEYVLMMDEVDENTNKKVVDTQMVSLWCARLGKRHKEISTQEANTTYSYQLLR